MTIELRDREYEPQTKQIFFNVYVDGVQTVWIAVYDRGDELHLSDIFPIINRSGALGIGGVRQLVRELKKEFPRATKLSMIRYGGAKHQLEDPEPDTEEEYHTVEWKL